MREYYPPQLLDAYLSHCPGGDALPNTSIRTHSLDARKLLAHAAVGPHVSLEDLLRAARGDIHLPNLPDARRPNLRACADLARVLALQGIQPEDEVDSLALYELILNLFGPEQIPSVHQGVHAQLAYRLGRFTRTRMLLERYASIRDIIRFSLELDLTNPFIRSEKADPSPWLGRFESLLPPTRLSLGTGHGAPFDRLNAAVPQMARHEARISVIVTCFEPTADLLTAVRSLTRQSWPNVEVLVVDDGSPKDHDRLLRQCLQLDDRIRLIRLPVNVGTYRARNVALDAAIGDFITFLDSDDWSHPRRLENQVRPLLTDNSLVGTTSWTLLGTESLELTRVGFNSRMRYPASLMFRKNAVLKQIGYFDGVRKGADNEYIRRIEATFGPKSVYHVREVLHLYRVRPDSLSRSDFRPGWMHPARFAYRSAYTLWHREIQAGKADSYLAKDPPRRPFPAPAHIGAAGRASAGAGSYDVVFAGDWRKVHGPQRQMIEEMEVLSGHGARVGVMQMETFRWMTSQRLPLSPPVQRLINRGIVTGCVPTEKHKTALVLVRDPSVLQFPPYQPPSLASRSVIIVASRAPRGGDDTDVRYSPQACTVAARHLFAAPALWVPQDHQVRRALETSGLPQGELASFVMPGVIDPQRWCPERTRFRSNSPVVGRHSRDSSSAWPRDRETLLRVYPDSLDIRLLGGADAAREILGDAMLPPNWLAYDYDDVDIRSFLFQIDFWVYYPHPAEAEASNREILEALASGCVVIVPHRFSETFGDAALYRHPTQVKETIRTYYERPKLFLDQSRRGRMRVAEWFNPATYLGQISTMLGAASPFRYPSKESTRALC